MHRQRLALPVDREAQDDSDEREREISSPHRRLVSFGSDTSGVIGSECMGFLFGGE